MRGVSRRRTFVRALALLLAVQLVHPAWAAPGDITQVAAPVLGSDPPKARDLGDGDASVSTQTGALTYSYPIAVPPGRGSMQPSLALSYSSQAPSYGGIAAGWSLSIPEIHLDTSHSVLEQRYLGGILDPNAWRKRRFVSEMAGGRPLVEVTESAASDVRATYRAQNDSSYARYERMIPTASYRWRVRSTDGVIRYFGDVALASAGSELWAPLTREVDAYGNTVEYEWTGTDITEIRYTSNPALGLAPFAIVEFERDSSGCTGRVGWHEDARLGIVRGATKLTKIRARAIDGALTRHTREITLEYDADRECGAMHGPMRVLTSIQESAWGDTVPRVDLPAVTFEYNRFARTLDEAHAIPAADLWSDDALPNNLSWGIRQPGAEWPSIEGMLLDFDGDGLQDRLYAVQDGVTCKYAWRRNLGRQADGNIVFADSGMPPQTLPVLPWTQAGVKGSTEWCSLSGQLTMKANIPAPPPPNQPACPATSGTYLAYRWLDMNEDGLPDLVTAIHHDPQWFDPDAEAWFGPWPSCDGSSAGECPVMDSACMDEALACVDDDPCTYDGEEVDACMAGVSTGPCETRVAARAGTTTQSCSDSCTQQNWVATQQDCADFPQQCQDRCNTLCSSSDSIDPTGPPNSLSCDAKVPHRRCGRYPWMVYENKGGFFETTPVIKYQPLPLESDNGDSSFGGGTLSSTRHGLQDLDGDGDLDAIVRDRAATQGGSMHWWLVFLGDGAGNFTEHESGHPYLWPVPPRAPVSLSCTSQPGATCSAIAVAPVQTDNFDVRGLATIIDLNGDGASDLLWKHAPDQFDESLERPPVWRPVQDGDWIDYFRGNGRQFEYRGSASAPEGVRLNLFAPAIEHVSRSFYDSTANLGLFSTTGVRTSKARFVDIDSDGRPDLVEAGRSSGGWEHPSLFINDGGSFIAPFALDATWRSRLEQRTDAAPTTFADPKRAYGWQTTKDLIDLDGDGLPEAWDFTGSIAMYHADSDEQPLRLMNRIDNGRGGVTEVEYAATTDASVVTQNTAIQANDPVRRALPHVQWVVSKLETHDAWDPADSSTTAYEYVHPVWRRDDEQRWGFRGFEEVRATTPSGALHVDTYGFDVDWSGRLKGSRVYEAADASARTHPRTIRETTWESRSLFAAKLWTFHPTATRSWTCRNGQTEAQCRSTSSGFVKTSTVWAQVAAAGGPYQAFVEQQVYTQDSEAFDNGDRRTFDVYTLHSDAAQYQLKLGTHAELTLINGVHTWTDYQSWEYDAAYRHPLRHSQYVSVTGSGSPDYATRAVTAWEYEATGVVKNRQQPRNFPAGPKEHYLHDSTQRFVTTTTNELGHVVTADYEPGTGAQRWERGPNSASCGTGCTNFEQVWTDVDGLGRPIASYVNRGANGVPWTKTRVAQTTYVDAIVSGARPHVVSETLIDYDATPARWTREETRLDGLGRPQQIIVSTGGPIDAVTTYDYDHRGHLVAVTLPDPSANSAATVTYTYAFDSIGRPTGMRRPAIGGAPSGVDLSYDGLVHTSEEVPGGLGGPVARKTLVHDAFGRLSEVREYTDLAAGTYAATTYQYDARDAVTRIQNPDGVVTSLIHDLGGRRTRIERAGRTWTYTYWADGQLASETVPGPTGVSTSTFAYDVLGRPSSRVVATRGMSTADQALFGIGTIDFDHDTCTNGVGRLCAVSHPGTLDATYAYDAEGNVTSESRAYDFAGLTGAREIGATFGPGGRVVSQTYADNATGETTRTEARFTYDDRAKPATVAWVAPGAAPRPVAVQTRNVAGLVTSRAAPLSGVATGWRSFSSDWTYDPLTRVTSQIITDSTSTQHAAQEIDYYGLDDPQALRHWLASAAYEMSFTYDARHQLTGVSEAAGKLSASYGFTLGGKLSSSSITATSAPGGAVVNRTVGHAYASGVDPEAPSALTVTGAPNLRSYSYDTIGNLVDVRAGDPTSNPTDTFLYDGEDQLRRATKWDGTSITGTEEYFYDHAGQRAGIVTRDAAGAITGARIFFGETEIELNADGDIVQAYAHLSLGTPVARVESPKNGWYPGASTTMAGFLELQYHGLSSNTLVTLRPDGAVEAGFVYAPYGELLETTGASIDDQHRRFNDKFRDDLTGLTYYGVRYYDPLSLTWTQADPLYRFSPDAAWAEPRRANLYTFTGGNALRYIDPDGRDLESFVRKTAAVVGGYTGVGGLVVDNHYEIKKYRDGRSGRETMLRRVGANDLRIAGRLVSALTKARGVDILADWAASELDDRDDGQSLSLDQMLQMRAAAGAPPAPAVGSQVGGVVVRNIDDAETVVRGGTGDMPPPGTVVSGAVGADLADAAQGLQHGQLRATTAGAIRAAGGTVDHAPEPAFDGGPINPKHVNICIPAGGCFGPLQPNPVPKAQRVPSKPKK